MSFYRITDPRKRDAMVEEYLATVKRMKQRNFDERLGELAQQKERRDVLNPLIESNNKTTKAITNELRPMKKEIEDLNKHLRNEDALVTRGRKRKRKGVPILLEEGDRSRQDMYFGIQKDSKNRFILGNKEIKIDENNNDIRVEGVTYRGSSGLWSLVMDISPVHYTNDDYENYRKLVLQTDLINNPTGVQQNSKPERTNKYKNFLAKIVDGHESSKKQDNDDDGEVGEEEEEEEEEKEKEEQERGVEEHGHGIQFLPSTIKGLFEKLQLLAAEFIAGNTTTKNELVAVLDELRRRRSITEKEYTTINTLLSKS